MHWYDDISFGAGDPSTLQRCVLFLEKLGVNFDDDGSEGTANQMRVISLAAQRSMLDIVNEEASPANRKQTTLEMRRDLLSLSWLEGELDTPWRLLIEEEFPGPSLQEEEEFERLAGNASKHILMQAELDQRLSTLTLEIHTLLNQEGYLLADHDTQLVSSLAMTIIMLETALSGDNSEEARQKFKENAEWLIEQMSDPNHHVWDTLLLKYVISKQND